MARPAPRFLRVIATLAMAWAMAMPHNAIAQSNDAELPFVAITLTTNSAEIQAIIDGMQDQLAVRGYWTKDTIRIEVANTGADPSHAVNQVRAFVRDGADVLVAINVPSIEAAVAADNQVHLVVAGVSLEIADGYKRVHRRHNVTGIVSGVTHNEQFMLIREILPEVRTVAIPIDPADSQIQARLQELRAIAQHQNMDIMALPVSVLHNAVNNRISELGPTTSAILLDRGLLPSAPVETLAAAAEQRGLLLFATDEDSVIRGALAAMVVEPFGVGVQLGDLVARILDEPTTIRAPFERARAAHLVINGDARAKLDVAALEQEVTRMHRTVLEWAEITGPMPRIKPSAPIPPPPLGIARGIETPTPRAKPSPPPD